MSVSTDDPRVSLNYIAFQIASANRERRERIATAVLAGFAARQTPDILADEYVAYSVMWADALIAELDKA